ncbi:MAG: nucleotidyltransferase family protein [Candidatus Omnitrophica bacterium]|nr:nucleotidyltransferase family protein [Candidatus Omnitrophota bacterium]
MIVLVLAAGYATRLYPLTLDTPKPLLKVGHKLLIEHIFDKVGRLDGVKKCFVVTNDKFFDKLEKWANTFSAGGGSAMNSVKSGIGGGLSMLIRVVNDMTTTNENRLGAIRDIEFVVQKEKIDDDLLVIGGDNLFGFALTDFVKFANGRKPNASFAVFDIKERKKASIYGVVKVDSSSKVVDFQEKPSNPGSSLISTCVYYFPREKLNLISKYLAVEKRSDATGNYIKWLSETDGIYGFIFREKWYDIGDIESYKKANEEYKGG